MGDPNLLTFILNLLTFFLFLQKIENNEKIRHLPRKDIGFPAGYVCYHANSFHSQLLASGECRHGSVYRDSERILHRVVH